MIVRRLPAVTAALVALGTLSACTSQPSTRTVAEEIVETLDGVSQEVKDCLTEKLEGYSNDELDAIGEANPDFSSTSPGMTQTPELEAFIADLAACNEDAGAAGEPSDDSTADDTATSAEASTDDSTVEGTTDDSSADSESTDATSVDTTEG